MYYKLTINETGRSSLKDEDLVLNGVVNALIVDKEGETNEKVRQFIDNLKVLFTDSSDEE